MTILKNKVFQNFSYLTISSILSQLIALITILKISRAFAPEEYGVYTFIFAQSQLINVIGDLGMRNVIIRAIARDPKRTNDLIYNGLLLRIIASIALMLLYLIYNYFFGSLNVLQISVLFLFAVTSIVSNLFENVFLGQQKMLIPSIFNLGFNIIWAIIIFVLPISNFTVILLLIIQLLIGFVKSGLLFGLMKKHEMFVGNINKFYDSSIIILKESWPYFSQMLLLLPVMYLSNNFLDINSTKTEIGYFNLSQKLLGPVTMVIGMGLSAVFPNLSSLWSKDSSRFYLIISNGFKYIFLSALMLTFLFTIFANEIVLLLFTEEYLPAVKVCQLQVWYVFLMGINSFIGTIWGAENKEKLILKTSIVNALIATPLLFIGSRYGALGLSYGYVVSFSLFEIYLWYLFQKKLKIKIQYALWYWSLAIILFIISYIISKNMPIVYKLTLVIPMVIGLGFYLKSCKKNISYEN
jgi:O-antigen/teichoic acid export membrane protein